MKSLLSVACLSFCLVAIGCNKGEPGGKDVVKDKDKTSDNNFSLDVPNTATKIKQGETKNTSIAVKKGKAFSDDVKLKFSDLPKGVTIDPESPTIAKNETEAKIAIKAAEDAAVGDFTVRVAGTPNKGETAKSEFKVTVQAK